MSNFGLTPSTSALAAAVNETEIDSGCKWSLATLCSQARVLVRFRQYNHEFANVQPSNTTRVCNDDVRR